MIGVVLRAYCSALLLAALLFNDLLVTVVRDKSNKVAKKDEIG
jgi:hypothetical protein